MVVAYLGQLPLWLLIQFVSSEYLVVVAYLGSYLITGLDYMDRIAGLD